MAFFAEDDIYNQPAWNHRPREAPNPPDVHSDSPLPSLQSSAIEWGSKDPLLSSPLASGSGLTGAMSDCTIDSGSSQLTVATQLTVSTNVADYGGKSCPIIKYAWVGGGT